MMMAKTELNKKRKIIKNKLTGRMICVRLPRPASYSLPTVYARGSISSRGNLVSQHHIFWVSLRRRARPKLSDILQLAQCLKLVCIDGFAIVFHDAISDTTKLLICALHAHGVERTVQLLSR